MASVRAKPGRRVPWPLIAAVFGVVLIAVLATVLATVTPPSSPSSYPVRSGTLLVGPATYTLNRGFFGVNVQEIGIGTSILSQRVNATPLEFFRFTPSVESTDQVAGLTYTGNGFASPNIGYTDSEFVQWCRERNCQAVMAVPAEINNTAIAAETVRYVETTLGFHPAFWAIGNEPQTWEHWGIPWSQWRVTDNSTPTPQQYGAEVRAYALALRQVDPRIRLIGLESVGAGPAMDPWFTAVMTEAGKYLAAVAYHLYPGGVVGSQATLTGFYATLYNPRRLAESYIDTTATVRRACPSCHVLVLVDEFNSALAGGYDSELIGYPNAVYIGASLIQAIRLGIPRVSYFDLADLNPTLPYGMLLTGGTPRPTYQLYSTILANLTLGAVHNASFYSFPSGPFTIVTTNGTARSLLIVNGNDGIGFSLEWRNGLGPSGITRIWSWSPGTSAPVYVSSTGGNQPDSSLVPPQGILLVTVD